MVPGSRSTTRWLVLCVTFAAMHAYVASFHNPVSPFCAATPFLALRGRGTNPHGQILISFRFVMHFKSKRRGLKMNAACGSRQRSRQVAAYERTWRSRERDLGKREGKESAEMQVFLEKIRDGGVCAGAAGRKLHEKYAAEMVFDIDAGRPSRGRDVPFVGSGGEDEAPTVGEIGEGFLVLQSDEVAGRGRRKKIRTVGDRWTPDEEELERLASLCRAKISRGRS